MPVEPVGEGRILALNVPADLEVASRAAAVPHVRHLIRPYRLRTAPLQTAAPGAVGP
ncbi:hypothetical protein [Streptomyces sp. NPDC018711]|uniref:hypothetical protein n=1 Tax=Streptomyces sp. NPDC018711 TaxID=3365052 RepID=UPI0037A8906B